MTGHKRKRGGCMSTSMAPCEGGGEEIVVTSGGAAAVPATITTTLYDLIAALQEVVRPGEETLVVATVVSLLRAGRICAMAREISRRRPRQQCKIEWMISSDAFCVPPTMHAQ